MSGHEPFSLVNWKESHECRNNSIKVRFYVSRASLRISTAADVLTLSNTNAQTCMCGKIRAQKGLRIYVSPAVFKVSVE